MSEETTEAADRGGMTLLAAGTLGVRIAAGWRVSQQGFATATLFPDGIEHAALQIEVASYEDPNAVSAEDYSDFLDDEAQQLCAESGLSGATGLIIKGSWVDQENGSHRQIWRLLKSLFPDHVRMATFTLSVPLTQVAAPATERLADEVEAMVQRAAFARSLTALDQVAPTRDMKRVSLWNMIHMRVPAEWRFIREDGDGTGMYRGEPEDEAERGREAFWVNFDEFRRQNEADADETTDHRTLITELTTRISSELKASNREAEVEFLGDCDGLLSYQYEQDSDGEQLRVYRWFRFAAVHDAMIMGIFSFVAAENDDDGAKLGDRAAMLGREIRNAVFGSPEPAASR